MAQEIQFVNMHMVPMPKIIKRELDTDDDDEIIPCAMCTKEFASQVALRNHMRNEHTDAFSQMTILPEAIKKEPIKPENCTSKPVAPKVTPVQLKGIKAGMKTIVVKSGPTHKMKEELDKKIKEREQALLESMRPGRLQDIVSKDVKYIIVKSDKEIMKTRRKYQDQDIDETSEVQATATKRKKTADDKEGKPKKDRDRERGEEKRDPHPITGPFECLQPSTLVSSGSCHQIFFSCCDYSIHYRDEHSKRRKSNGNRCQVCEKPLNGGDMLDAPFNCQVCGAGFISNKDLANHTAIDHVKLKPFQCNVCQKRFTQQGGLQQHMRMHTGVRPYSCTYCTKAFTQKSGLDQHLRIHTKVKPYHCIVCGKSFIQSVHLKQHIRTHTNVAPFQCAICQKRFKQSSHLSYHLKNHNAFLMTDEQKVKYEELMKEINANEARAAMVGREVVRRPRRNKGGSEEQEKVVVVSQGEGQQQQVMVLQQYVDADSGHYVTESVHLENEVLEEEATDESVYLTKELSEQDHQEQLLAEQSIQIEGETYILGEEEMWEDADAEDADADAEDADADAEDADADAEEVTE